MLQIYLFGRNQLENINITFYNILCNTFYQEMRMNFFRKSKKSNPLIISESNIADADINELISTAKKSGYSSIVIELNDNHTENEYTLPLNNDSKNSSQPLTCIVNERHDIQSSATVPINSGNELIIDENDYTAFISDSSGKLICRIYEFPFSHPEFSGIIFEFSGEYSLSCMLSSENQADIMVEDEPLYPGNKISLFSGCSFSVSGREYFFYITN